MNNDKKILNPLTNKFIKIGGKVYNDLVHNGVISIDKTEKFIEKIRNPLTGRLIKKGSAIYNELITKNKIKPDAKIEKKVRPFSVPTEYKVTEKFKKYPIDREEVPWGTKKPSTVGERRFIRENCGESCFLMPEKNKFPICNKTLPCTYNCRGLKAASSRAGEHKYTKVLEKSKMLTALFNCYKK